ncbi:hypothetical protein [Treponema primitia]|uniref:hypothetical protein n=1 Tax=Treponema primitia TaxID=88058 RepID=UPI0004753F5A|nr:hypothetical protein [Treponema primitia]
MGIKDYKLLNHRNKTITHYLREEPQDIVIDCDTGRGKEILGSLWDRLMQENFQYLSIPGKPRTLIKETEYEEEGLVFHFIERFILPV